MPERLRDLILSIRRYINILFTYLLTYVTDDHKQTECVITTGVMFGMRSFAPMIGYALGAWANSIYVDLSGNLVFVFRTVIEITAAVRSNLSCTKDK